MPQHPNDEWEDAPGASGQLMAVQFLIHNGFILDSYKWFPPLDGRDPTDKQIRAIQYLIDKWSYGPLAISI